MTTREWAKLVLVVLALGILYWPGIQQHWQMARDPYFVPFDAVQYIPAFFKFDPREPIPTTDLKEYYLNAVCPVLYKGSLMIGAQIADVRHFQLGLMYVAYAVFIGVLGRLGWLLGGAALSFAVMAFSITAWIFIGLGFIGGAPRMYSYPLISLVLYSLIRDRPHLLAVTTVFGALFYPIVATVAGLCLAAWMLCRPLAGQGVVSRWGLSRRLITLALTGVLSVASLLPLVLGAEPYGRRVVEADIAMYPEAGADGNYRPYDQIPYRLFGNELFTYFVGPLYGHGDPIVSWLNVHQQLDPINLLFVLVLTGLIVLIVILNGMKLMLRDDRSGGIARLLGFFAVCGALHVIAWLAAPYLYMPTRYLMLSLPFLIVLVFPWCLNTVLTRVPRLHSSSKLRAIVFLAVVCGYLLAFGARGNVDFSTSTIAKPAQPLFDAIAGLPKDVIVAGWPVGVLRKMEYATKRNAFLTGDLHQVLHLHFMKAMRHRMDALFDAYLSTDVAPLYRLRHDFGVTHLLVETRDFTEPGQPPEYFSPWRHRIPRRLSEIRGKEYLMNESLHQQAAVYNRDGFILLDLGRLP